MWLNAQVLKLGVKEKSNQSKSRPYFDVHSCLNDFIVRLSHTGVRYPYKSIEGKTFRGTSQYVSKNSQPSQRRKCRRMDASFGASRVRKY